MKKTGKQQTSKRKVGRWKKGQSGNKSGRPKGVPNKATQEVKALCTRLVEDPVYLRNLQRRLRDGTLNGSVESMIWHYAKGKPKETVAIEGGDVPLRFTLSLDNQRVLTP